MTEAEVPKLRIKAAIGSIRAARWTCPNKLCNHGSIVDGLRSPECIKALLEDQHLTVTCPACDLVFEVDATKSRLVRANGRRL